MLWVKSYWNFFPPKLKIKAEGPDAQEVVNALRELVEEKHFDEPLPKK